MTELLDGTVEVRASSNGAPVAVRAAGRWVEVEAVALTWRVETDWWRTPVARDYVRCLLAGGECVDVYRDLQTGEWFWSRRYD